MAAAESAEAALKAGGERTEAVSSSEFADVKLATILSGETNERGIPYVRFIASVEELLASAEGASVESLIGAFNELHQKYKVLETHKVRTRQAMKQKIPEIKRTLELVQHLTERHEKNEDFTAHYSLSDMLYARAKIHSKGFVCLWLGANVMVEYPYEEAMQILTVSLTNARDRLHICDADLETLRDQIITVEVNMARVFNFDVKRRRELKNSGGAKV